MNKGALLLVAVGIGIIVSLGVCELLPKDEKTGMVEAEWRFTIAAQKEASTSKEQNPPHERKGEERIGNYRKIEDVLLMRMARFADRSFRAQLSQQYLSVAPAEIRGLSNSVIRVFNEMTYEVAEDALAIIMKVRALNEGIALSVLNFLRDAVVAEVDAEWELRCKLVCAQAECNVQRCRKQGHDTAKWEHELTRVKAIMDAQRERIHTLSEPHIVRRREVSHE